MRYDKEKIIDDLKLVPFGSQGWLTNKNMECPYCGKSGKWGVIFNNSGAATFHCWKCPRKTSLYDFLKKIDRLDLTHKTYTAKPTEVLQKIETHQEVSDWMVGKSGERVLTPVKLPMRLKPLVNDEYLNGRGWLPEHYEEFEPSYTDSCLERKLNNYIIFKMKVDGVCVAWWARSRYSKEWHKDNLEAYKNHKAELVLRYRNSENNFQDLLGGCDELIKGEIHTVIIVEGIMDKVNIDRLLDLHNCKDIKCCFTFGNNIGRGQIEELLRKNVKKVILLYDYKTIEESKEASMKMKDLFECVLVTAIRKEGVDPGNISMEYLLKVLEEATDPLSYFCGKIETKY